jgi:hypothetical protein
MKKQRSVIYTINKEETMKTLVFGVLLIPFILLLTSCPEGLDQSPFVSIDSPSDGYIVMAEGSDANGLYKTITFEGTATDQEDDDNTLLVEWFSSTDGKLGEGRTLTTRVHMTEPCSQQIDITLRVTDSAANVTEVSIQIVLYIVC